MSFNITFEGMLRLLAAPPQLHVGLLSELVKGYNYGII